MYLSLNTRLLSLTKEESVMSTTLQIKLLKTILFVFSEMYFRSCAKTFVNTLTPLHFEISLFYAFFWGHTIWSCNLLCLYFPILDLTITNFDFRSLPFSFQNYICFVWDIFSYKFYAGFLLMLFFRSKNFEVFLRYIFADKSICLLKYY